ncbi:MAG: hypothetical protein AAFX99_32815, partial [Myxococcota bacterium]
LSRPYPIWVGDELVQTSHSLPLKLAAVLVGLAMGALIAHTTWLGRGERVQTFRPDSWRGRLFGPQRNGRAEPSQPPVEPSPPQPAAPQPAEGSPPPSQQSSADG